MTFSIFVVGAPILVGARGSCPICPMVNPALYLEYYGFAFVSTAIFCGIDFFRDCRLYRLQ